MQTLSLNTKLIAGCMIMLGFSLMLSATLILMYGRFYVRADKDLGLLTTFTRVLVAADRLSAERGPMNSVLGEEVNPDSPAWHRLSDARKAADDALDAILRPLPGALDFSQDDDLVNAVGRLRLMIKRARRDADDLMRKPRAERTAEAIAYVLRGMFETVNQIRPLSMAAMAKITAEDESLAGPALMAQMLGELREYSGRLASIIMPYVAAKQPLTEATQFDLARTRERIVEIWQLAGRQAGLFPDDDALAGLRIAVNSTYFVRGMQLVDIAVARGRLTGDFGITTGELTDRYVPTLRPIEDLKTGFLQAAFDRLDTQRSHALTWLVVMSIAAGVIVLATVALIAAARHFVLKPLLSASDHIVALSNGQPLDELKSPTESIEMLRLFDALEGLRVTLGEREQHTEQLKVLSETDSLTGLINRRLFDRIGHGDAEFDRLSRDVSIIMMDLDRFKGINDTYGHLAGDLVLKLAAQIVQGVCRKSDLAARYGGEEIAIVIFDQDAWVAMHIAERIRRDLEAEPLVLADGRTIPVTASFGVAQGRRGGSHWLPLIKAADAALYKAKATGRNRVCQANGGEPAPNRHVA